LRQLLLENISIKHDGFAQPALRLGFVLTASLSAEVTFIVGEKDRKLPLRRWKEAFSAKG